MKKFFAKHIGLLAFAVAVMVCIFFFTYTLSLVTDYSSQVNEQATERAESYTRQQAVFVQQQCDLLKQKTQYYAQQLSQSTSWDDFREGAAQIHMMGSGDDMLLEMFYFKNGGIFTWNGQPCTDQPVLETLKLSEDTLLSKVFQFENRIMSIAVSAPVDSPYADGIALVFARTAISLSDYAYDNDRQQIPCVSNAAFALLCKHDGKVIDRIENTDVFSISNEPVQHGLLQDLFTDAEVSQAAVKALSDNTLTSFPFQKNGKGYILSIYSFPDTMGGLTLLCGYEESMVFGSGYQMMDSITSALLGLAMVMAILIGAIVFTWGRARHRIYRMEMIDPVLNCATTKMFCRTAATLLKQNQDSDYAMVSLNINNFGYVKEHLGDHAAKKLSGFVVDIIRNALRVEETFAYAGEGEFLLMLHERNRQVLSERLNGLYLRSSAYDQFEDANYKVSIGFAVYEVERSEKQDISRMLDKLKMAKDAITIQTGYFSISYYEDMMHENYIRKAEIEGKMEQALQNSEFHLFYQPKYNLKAKNMDGCEILIRWYDPELGKYHTPGEFLPVFEENHFIIKLDHFVFFKACENIAKRVESRQLCYPVSVNVSRVTAIQPDFVDYYARIKDKFNIKDGFVTLEFTESFAYENYEFLGEIVEKLHRNGFECSIDDFGTGYSSYNILKTIPMDEIKLDKFFLSKGLSQQRDQTVLESVIAMVKKLGMKVTQEGVETKEELYRLEELGCDVIQGYYFAKPMKYSDYCQFIDENFT